MNLDEWTDLVKNTIGAADFKAIAVAFLREHFRRSVLYADGTGDGGVDAWVVMQAEPLVRAPAQFHSGKSEPWSKKLASDVETLAAFRDGLAADNPTRSDLARLFFVCSQTPSAVDVEEQCAALLVKHGVAARVFDARAIVSCALENRAESFQLIAARIPGYESAAARLPNARDEALVAFSLFHANPAKYRHAVAKSGIATVLHRSNGEIDRVTLLTQVEELLCVSNPSNMISHALRNLARESLLTVEGDSIRATETLLGRTRASLVVAKRDEDSLRALCARTIDAKIAKGTHRRDTVVTRVVDTVFADLGLLVREPIAERVQQALDPGSRPNTKYDGEAFRRWRAVSQRVESELGTGLAHEVLGDLVKVIATAPFAKSLAGAELFLRLTEHDAQEYERVLEASAQQVMIDPSIAMPMVCALFDKVVPTWQTSVAAHSLFESLAARGAQCVVPSVYVEEIAWHLLKARDYVELIETEEDLERSANYFVAHYCSATAGAGPRSRKDFLQLLTDFGVPAKATDTLPAERRRLEPRVASILRRYQFDIEQVQVRADDARLPQEPRRPSVLLDHDRAVVRALREWTRSSERWLVCTADVWLRGVLNDLDVLALDSAGLGDMLELVRPTGTDRPLVSPVELAMTIGEQERELAAGVWDAIVRIEGENLTDRALVRHAREFRQGWLKSRRDVTEIDSEWAKYRAQSADA